MDFIASFEDGTPFEVTAPNTTEFSFRDERANRLCNGRSEIGNKNLRTNGLLWVDTSCFAQPPAGFFGNSGIGILTGPGINNWDIGVHKNFRIHESAQLQFRGEFFTAFNHAQFADPDSGVTHTNFGEVTSTREDAREIQLAVSFTF